MNKKLIKLTVVFCLIISMVQLAPKKAHAIFGVGDVTFTTQVADVSASGISNWANIIATHLKDYVLDHLATIIAKQILHQLTLSVIDWINSGYQGNPAFLTNPGDFFSNVADQVAGDFISNSGPLAQLCSPFSVDIRLSIGLQQSKGQKNKYACTLSGVINNVQNGVTVNGRSIQGFLGGDFSQGGWAAFISMTTEPQNNAAGAYLQAQSDIQASIASKHAAVKLDLQLGQGFLSYQTCTDVTSEFESGESDLANPSDLSAHGDQSVVTDQDDFGNNSTIQKKVDPKTGNVSYKNCQTQTPGSVVASKLFANTNSSELELALADSINSVISAAITQLTSSLLQKGLHALSSSGSSGSGRSYTQDALQSIIAQSRTDISSTQTAAVNAATSGGTQSLTTNKASYDQAVTAISGSKTNLAAAAACFDTKVGIPATVPRGVTGDYGTTQAAATRSWSTTHLDAILSNLVAKQQSITNQIAAIQGGITTQSTPSSLDDLQQQLPTYQNTIQSSLQATQADTNAAAQDLANTQIFAQQADQLAVQLKVACDAYPAQQIYVSFP